MSDEAADLRRQLAEITEDRDSYQRTFDLQWEADMRAIKRWREANPGNDLVWPDRANMVVWLMEEHDKVVKLLADPVAVHINMLRGGIAKPSWQNIKHLYPEQFQDNDKTI